MQLTAAESTLPASTETGSGAELVWSSHPLAEEPRLRSALLGVVIGAVSVAAAVVFQGSGYGLISLAVLTGSMSRYFLPTRYRVDEGGVRASHLGRSRMRAWEQIRRADHRRDGIFLSPFPRPSRLDSFQGIYLRFHHNQDQIKDFVQAHVPSESL